MIVGMLRTGVEMLGKEAETKTEKKETKGTTQKTSSAIKQKSGSGDIPITWPLYLVMVIKSYGAVQSKRRLCYCKSL